MMRPYNYPKHSSQPLLVQGLEFYCMNCFCYIYLTPPMFLRFNKKPLRCAAPHKTPIQQTNNPILNHDNTCHNSLGGVLFSIAYTNYIYGINIQTSLCSKKVMVLACTEYSAGFYQTCSQQRFSNFENDHSSSGNNIQQSELLLIYTRITS